MTTRDTVQGYFDSLKQKKTWEDFLSDEMTFTFFTTPIKRATGRDAYLESTKRFFSMISALEVKSLVVEGEKACALTRLELQPPGGPTFDCHVAEVFEVRKGVVVDYDAAGSIEGIDIDNASHKVELDRLVLSGLSSEIERAVG